jgi:release factor glutamine methyltransferase
VAYILGKKEFWSLPFEVNTGVLIPRPETEAVVEEVLLIAAEIASGRIDILDVGTGSGAIVISLAAELPQAVITAVDISFPTLLTARKNACTHGVDGRTVFICGNLCEPLRGKFDIVVSNPPYIAEKDYETLDEDVRKYEPRRALVAGPIGTEVHAALIRGGVSVLKRGGWLVMEMGAGQEHDIEGMFAASGFFGNSRCRKDYAGIPRVIIAQRKEV